MSDNSTKGSVLLADDLTGACDSAVQFQMRGAKSIVHLNSAPSAAGLFDLEAFSTNSRDLERHEIEERIRAIAYRLPGSQPQIVFKKIDSTLRGNAGWEIITALRAFGCDLAVIAPAFPEMGRFVRGGKLHVDTDSGWTPIDLAALLRSQGADRCAHVALGAASDAIARGDRYLTFDTTCNNDLNLIAAEALRSGRRVLWAGSAGLAAALARALFSDSEKRRAVQYQTHRPVLFCIGSDHPVTTAQAAEVLRGRAASELSAAGTTAGKLVESLRQGHVVLRIPHGSTAPDRLRCLLTGVQEQVGAIVLSGGDTASLLCRSMGAGAILPVDEIVRGLPWGRISGGSFDGLPIATKSGGFGQADALLQAADFFTCPGR